MLFAISFGSVSIDIDKIIIHLLNQFPGISLNSNLTDTEISILNQIRLPRVFLAGLVGAALSLSGATYQGAFKNDLADPYLLGVASGAGLGATISIVFGVHSLANSVPATTFFSFIGALLAVVMVVSFARFAGKDSSNLLLAGVAVAAFLTAIQTYMLQANRDSIVQVYIWILGGLSTSGWDEVLLIAPYVLICGVPLIMLGKYLDVLRVGDSEAKSLGINPTKIRLTVVLFATLLTAAAVSVSGLISFVGLIVPHTVRIVFGSSYKSLLIYSVIIGSAFLILADVGSRILVSSQLPIGVVTAGIGAPFFIFILATRNNHA